MFEKFKMGGKISNEEIHEKINKVKWFQTFEVAPGIVTPGKFPVGEKKFLNQLKIDENLSGLKILDVGTLDGAVAFEFERRGAQTFAMDIQDPNRTGFNTAKEILNSNVEYKQGTVYDLTKLYDAETFDIVCFKGVYYHLKDPITAIEQVSDVTKINGKIIVAGEILLTYAESLDGKIIKEKDVKKIAESDIPLTVCYPGKLKQHQSSCWFVPNLACLKSWLIACGLELDYYKTFEGTNPLGWVTQRFNGIAIKKERTKNVEHPLF